jgi:hypothetical protein
MKRNNKKMVLFFVLGLGIFNFSLIACEKVTDSQENKDELSQLETGGMSDQQNVMYDKLLQMPEEELNDKELAGLIYLREEEKLARDVYLYLYEIFPIGPFLNIPKSEQMHMDAIKFLLDRYELEDPSIGKNLGEFVNPDLQGLYSRLTESGKEDVMEALKVGALIEEIDIVDLQKELDHSVDNQDIKFVYNNLISGSKNHLRAFTRVLKTYGVEYTPVVLTMEQYSEIVN